MKRVGLLTSGGDSPGMNACIRAVVRMGLSYGIKTYGVSRGYQGLILGEISELKTSQVGDILHRGGTILKTARCEEFRREEGQEKAIKVLDDFGIKDLIVIGGDGSLKGAIALKNKGINVFGLPATIDNDLPFTDFTIGFDTAVNTCIDAISKIRDTSSSHERTTVIEVMGRKCGDIALEAGLAGGAESILIPEIESDISKICNKILETALRGKTQNIIINAEGSGVLTRDLVEIIKNKTKRETKSVILSYLQRGGSPTAKDRILASRAGAKAVELLYKGEKNKAIGIRNGNIEYFDIEEALNMKKEINLEEYRLIDILSR